MLPMTQEIEFLKAQQGEEIYSTELEVVKLELELSRKKYELFKLKDERLKNIQNKNTNSKYEVLLTNTMKKYRVNLNERQYITEEQSGFNLGSVLGGNSFGEEYFDLELALKICKELSELDNVYTTSDYRFFMNWKTLKPYDLSIDSNLAKKVNFYKNANKFFALVAEPGEEYFESTPEVKEYNNLTKTQYETSYLALRFPLPYTPDEIINKVKEFVNKHPVFVLEYLYMRMGENYKSVELYIRCKAFREIDIQKQTSLSRSI